MGDRITTYRDCPKCGGKGTFECYEALSSNIKMDECEKCGYTVNYDFEETDDGVLITKVASQDQTQAERLREFIKTTLTNKYNVVHHELNSEEQTEMWSTINPKIVDNVLALCDQYAQQRALELLDELNSELPSKWENEGDMKDASHTYDVGYDQAIDDCRDVLTAKRLNLTKESHE